MNDSRHIKHSGNWEAVLWLEAELATICGSAQRRSFPHGSGTYWNVEAKIAGQTNDLVVIGAHLDSTAANDVAYQPKTDAAPGADDDWSGVAGVLEIASTLRALADQAQPLCSIRFVLFNAEEDGMVGSWAYAHALKELEGSPGEPSVVAMLAMDMIGWHSPGAASLSFEIHGTGSSEYANAKPGSDQLTSTLEAAAAQKAPNLSAQVYPLAGCKTDPATDHSDHSSFHYHDWPACLVCEDLWVGVCGVQQKAGNPHYHRSSDLPVHIDFAYVADIVRTVAAAAWMIAKP